MKRSTKGALAASAAGILLLGGAGSLAFWNATVTVPGGAIAAGELKLSTPDWGAGWLLDDGEDVPNDPYEPGDKVVPGDVITKVCTFDITAVGDHLRATLGASPAGFAAANALTADLDIDATYQIDGVAIPAEITEANGGDTVTATIAVTFDGASVNATQTLSATLNAVTITAQQVHS
jgi:alternate signal-mediated exported protein